MFHDNINQPGCRPKELIQDSLQKRPHIHLIHHRLQLNSQSMQRLLQRISILTKDVAVQLVQRFQDEMNKRPAVFRVGLLASEFSRVVVEVDVSP
jgi:hypothetical protein